jgi:YVTN family beta-propeller protein
MSMPEIYHRARTLLFAALFLPAAASAQLQGVYVANQGNFSDNNGSVTYYDVQAGKATPVLRNFGTLVQGLLLHEGRGYVASNTSDAIDVFDAVTHARIAQIEDVPSPRYLAVVGAGRTYVSNLFSGTVTILDLAGRRVTGTIQVGSNPEDIAVTGTRAYVANSGFGEDTTLTVIDTETDAVLATVPLGCDGPRHLEVDSDDEVWAFCTGRVIYDANWNIVGTTSGTAVILEGATGEIRKRIPLDGIVGAASFGQDSYHAAASREIFLIKGTEVLVFDTNENVLKETIHLSGTEEVGAIAYDAAAQHLYAGRIPGYDRAGFVSIHRRDGTEIGRFETGVAPAGLVLMESASGTSAAAAAELPRQLRLLPNYPNPFNPATTIPFEITSAGPATIKIYDLTGSEIAVLLESHLQPGRYEASWDAAGLPGGVYVVRLTSGVHSASRRIILLK